MIGSNQNNYLTIRKRGFLIMTVQTLTQTPAVNTNLLRRTLQADGLFEVIGGVTLIAGAKPLTMLFGLDAPSILVGSGIGMLFYAAWLFYIASQQPIRRWAALLAADLNIAWVIASGIILFTGWLPLTAASWWTIALIADAMIVFAVLQFYGVWQMSKR
jgi:hypothetical protein